MQVPSNLLLNYMGRPSLYLGFFVIAWGLVSTLTSQVKNYGGIVACRFLLGFVGKNYSVAKFLRSSPLTRLVYRGSLFRRRALLPLQMVHKEGISFPHEYFLLRVSAQWCLW